MIILEENFKWHLEAFASDLFIYIYIWRCGICGMWNGMVAIVWLL